jgi:sugar O-acyltransferase (sialic acid O-acetyltransferase NeuD family)
MREVSAKVRSSEKERNVVRLLVVGAGGHAKVVIDTARTAGFEIAGVIGSATDASEVLGVPVSREAAGIEADGFIVAVGDNRIRARLLQEYRGKGLVPLTVTHPSAILADSVTVGAGSFIAAGAIVCVDAVIGENVVLNTGCTVDHDCVVGDHALVGPTASLCGESQIGCGVTFGAGASIIPTKRVGDWTIVGAGAAVVTDIAGGIVCGGVPARQLARTRD